VLQSTEEYQDDARSLRKGYYASIAFLDEQIGRLLTCLDSQGLTGSTLVIFVSDHGDMLFDRGLFTKGAYFYDASVRVPLLMRLPGRVPAGVRVGTVVQHMDITASVLAAAGYSRDQLDAIYPHGMDLIRLAAGENAYPRRRDWAVCVFRNSGYGPGGTYFEPPIHATMFFDGRHKLNVYHELSGNLRRFQGELYDVQSDSLETDNLWNHPDHTEIKIRLMGRMLNWMMENELRTSGSRGGERFRQSVMKEYGSEEARRELRED
jgi:arylsulfatase A-like enzyme